ncbi:MAG: hypothetical protein LAP61_23175 [Acidobacteriia bacterium]|nr:hypothetical protein [Terriglobia bacterium]
MTGEAVREVEALRNSGGAAGVGPQGQRSANAVTALPAPTRKALPPAA